MTILFKLFIVRGKPDGRESWASTRTSRENEGASGTIAIKKAFSESLFSADDRGRTYMPCGARS